MGISAVMSFLLHAEECNKFNTFGLQNAGSGQKFSATTVVFVNVLFSVWHDLVVASEPLDLGVGVISVDLHHDLALFHGFHRLQLPRKSDWPLCGGRERE